MRRSLDVVVVLGAVAVLGLVGLVVFEVARTMEVAEDQRDQLRYGAAVGERVLLPEPIPGDVLMVFLRDGCRYCELIKAGLPVLLETGGPTPEDGGLRTSWLIRRDEGGTDLPFDRVLIDYDLGWTHTFRVEGYPMLFLVGSDGCVRWKRVGARRGLDYAKMVEEIRTAPRCG